MKHMCRRTAFISLLGMAAVVAGRGGHAERAFHDRESGLSFRYPRSWTVIGFSHTNSPRRLVAASYHVVARQVEGDCGGMRALQSLPPQGSAVLLFDDGSTSSVAAVRFGIGFPPHAGRFALSEF